MGKIDTEIKKLKHNLLCSAKEKGLYENFGDKQIRKLEDKHHYNSIKYGTPEEREKADKIQGFSQWARRVNDNEVKKEKC